MAIAIINTTGNRDGFENNFSEALCQHLGAGCELHVVQGNEISKIKLNRGLRILTIVCHAGTNNDQTHLDLGFPSVGMPPSQSANTPVVLAQLLRSAPQNTIVLLLSCSALSTDTMSMFFDQPNVRGTVSSPISVKALWGPLIVELIEQLVQLDPTKEDFDDEVARLISRLNTKYGMDTRFHFAGNMVIETSE